MSLSKTAQAAVAAGYGCHYGQYVADTQRPVVVKVPEYLKDAPTMWERLAGAVPPEAPKPARVHTNKPNAAQSETSGAAGTYRVITELHLPEPMPERLEYGNFDPQRAYPLAEKLAMYGLTVADIRRYTRMSDMAVSYWKRRGRVPQCYVAPLDAYFDWCYRNSIPVDPPPKKPGATRDMSTKPERPELDKPKCNTPRVAYPLRKRMEQAGVTILELSRHIDISEGPIRRWRNAGVIPEPYLEHIDRYLAWAVGESK